MHGLHVYYLAHDPVFSGALLILEDDVGIAVDDELFEFVTVSCDATLGQTASTERVFGNVRRMLLEHERRHLVRMWTTSDPAARTA